MSTGTTVQMISIMVLWVVRDGTGLARALNLTTMIASSTSTNNVIAAISQSRKSWNQTMSSMTEEAGCCSPSSQGEGWPRPAHATPPAAMTVTPVTTKMINRLSTSIVLCAPSTRNSALTRPLFAAHRRHDVGSAPLSTAFCHGRGSFCGAAGRGKSRPLKPQFQPCRNAPYRPVPLRQTACPQLSSDAAFKPRASGLD